MVKWNKLKWRKWHKWVSLMVGVPLVLLCLSGVILNHRPFFSDMDVSRGILPDDYRFRNWNNGLLKGTCSLDSNHVLIYGKAGVWKMNLQTQETTDFNDGFPKGVDHRTISRVVQTKDSVLYAAAQFSLYRKEKSKSWERVSVSDDEGNERTIPFDDTRLTDIALKGDSVVLTSRSHVYIYHPQTSKAEELVLASPEGKEPSVSLFRICWKLHSGEMFGMVGKLLADILAMVFIFLFVTGMIVWFWPKRIRRADKASLNKPRLIKQLKWNGVWHDKVGRLTIVLTLFVAVTGWFLRPPLLVLIANSEVGLLGTPENVWEDKLRALQYDERMDDWLLYTSDGFFSMKSLDPIPVLTECQPPVSVMGVNVLCCEYPPAEYSEEDRWEQQVWMVGSFTGLYAWHRPSGQVYDVINGITLPPHAQALPFGNVKVSGYSNDVFPSVLCSYDEGVITGHVSRPHPLPQPDTMAELPMSLWNLALEIHTGRIFTFLGVFSTLLYIFVIGIMVLILLGSGWVIRRSKSLSIRCLFGRLVNYPDKYEENK